MGASAPKLGTHETAKHERRAGGRRSKENYAQGGAIGSAQHADSRNDNLDGDDAQQNSLEPGEERHIQAHVVCCQAFTPTRKLGFHNDTSRLAARRRTQPACAVNAIATATARTGWTPATVQGAR